MKILLLTDIPPCSNFTQGLVIDQLCRFFPHGSIACFAVSYPQLDPVISPGLAWLPVQYYNRPIENLAIAAKTPRLHSLLDLCLYYYNGIKVRRIASEAIRYGREFGADTLWCTLQGHTMIRLALRVASGLGVPLLTQVFDPPTWELRHKSTSKIVQSKILNDFDNAVRNSRACSAMSFAMKREYAEKYGVKTVAFLPSLQSSVALPPAQKMNDENEMVIGMAGQVYAMTEWKVLIDALDSVDWRIGGRDVRIRFLGRWPPFSNVNKPLRIEYLGWHTQEDSVRLLSQADILYCPYWFDPTFEIEARLSFPAKLTTYLATGRPVLFHGPEYASPAVFLKDNDAGYLCHTNLPSDIINALTVLAMDMNLYSKIAHNGRIAFDKYLTLASLRRSLAEFLEVDENLLASAT